MKKDKTLYIYGAGNPEIIRLARIINARSPRWDSFQFLDDDEKKIGREIFGVPVAGSLTYLENVAPHDAELIVYIARTMEMRRKAVDKAAQYSIPFASLVHPDVNLDNVEIGMDTVVYWDVSISPHVKIGDHSMVCMGSVVTHECQIGRCVFISPGAILNSRIHVGDGAFIGANATLIPEITIGKNAVVGAGAVVTRNVNDGETVFGNPARVIFRKAVK